MLMTLIFQCTESECPVIFGHITVTLTDWLGHIPCLTSTLALPLDKDCKF